MTVYVTQETKHDFAKAEEFGELVFLMDSDDLNNNKNSPHNDRILAHLRTKLRFYDPAVDWLVIAGSPYVSAAIFFILGQMQLSGVQILRWDNRDFRYIPMYLDLRKENRA